MTTRVLFFVLFLISGCSQETEKIEVSASSYCREFNGANIAELSKRTDLESVRVLRDIYMDCDVEMKYTEKAYELARVAAASGHKEDIYIFNLLRSALQREGK
jgi:hypothetical protein